MGHMERHAELRVPAGQGGAREIDSPERIAVALGTERHLPWPPLCFWVERWPHWKRWWYSRRVAAAPSRRAVPAARRRRRRADLHAGRAAPRGARLPPAPVRSGTDGASASTSTSATSSGTAVSPHARPQRRSGPGRGDARAGRLQRLRSSNRPERRQFRRNLNNDCHGTLIMVGPSFGSRTSSKAFAYGRPSCTLHGFRPVESIESGAHRSPGRCASERGRDADR
jgi:hypothetical protein